MQEQLNKIAEEMLAPIITKARVFTVINIVLIIIVISLIVIFVKQHREIEKLEKENRQ